MVGVALSLVLALAVHSRDCRAQRLQPASEQRFELLNPVVVLLGRAIEGDVPLHQRCQAR